MARSNHLSRRRALGALTAFGASGLFSAAWAQQAPALAQGRLVVIFLRGAYDGLSVFVPYADPNYYRLRNHIAIPAPDGTAQTALRLDRSFGMHPALASLLPLWQQGVLTFLPSVGSPDPTRSHFEAQHQWEIATPGRNSAANGWLNSLSTLGQGTQTIALGVGESNPQILAGPATVQLIPRGQAATRQGALGNEQARRVLLDLYAGQDSLSQAFRQGASSRMETAQTLSAEAASTEMMAANNGAGSANGLPLDAKHLVTLMRQNRNLRLGFLSAGGWDTHANQGTAVGQLANILGNLASTVTQLRLEFSRPGDLIMVMSEFGRTCAENGTRGTDHGRGNAMWLIGDRVNGGRWHGGWEGLAQGQLNEGRDLPVRNDFRSVLAQVLRRNFGLSDSQLATVLPGASWDSSLDQLLKA